MTELREKTQLMSASEIERTVVRLVHEIVAKHDDLSDFVLVGIRRRGVPLAERLAALLERQTRVKVPVGMLDITLYRDDLSVMETQPIVHKGKLGVSIAGKDVLLVDDVLYTGRTTRAALDALFELGRPRRVQLCVLIDRGHRELPIEAAYAGRVVETLANEIVEVKLLEVDGDDRVMLVEQA